MTAAPPMLVPQRWDMPFDPRMTDADVERLLELEPFSRIDPAKFPRALPLRGVLKTDARLVGYRPADIVVREGGYGNSAFFIVSGRVRVVLGLPQALLGRRETRHRSFFAAVAQLWRNPRLPEVRNLAASRPRREIGSRDDEEGGSGRPHIFLQDFPAVIEPYGPPASLGPGQFFGEIAALGRTPHTATVVADTETDLLEIRWQGLRDIRRYAPEIKAHLDDLYRKNILLAHLRETPLFRHIRPEALEALAAATRFETHGDFDWYGTYRQRAEEIADGRIEPDPLIAEEGSYPNGVIFIRSGFARVTRRFGHGARTLRYLGCGQAFGFEEVAHNWRHGAQVPLRCTLRALGNVDILVVPTAAIEAHVLPTLPSELAPPPLDAPAPVAPEVRSKILEFLGGRRYINGTATMLVNLDRCTRCDACVDACAATHENNPRFVRHGHAIGPIMVANACMHCVDPVCMIGCPTGAISRASDGGEVVINDLTCIGCGTCAQSCPYDNIRMVEIRDEEGRIVRDAQTHAPILKATKCDLCVDQPGGPACARACPHDALVRTDMRDGPTLASWLAR